MKANQEGKYEIWLTYNDKERMQIPVNPSQISISNNSENETVKINGLGQITILQESGLKQFQFSSFFPSKWGPYCEYINIPKPWDGIKFIEENKNKSYLRFTITGTPINMFVTIEDFSYNEKCGDVGTVYYDITLKEYRSVKLRRISSKDFSSGRELFDWFSLNKKRTYRVSKDDSLIKIARKTGVKDWRDIARLNNIKAPYEIHSNQELKLP